MKQSSGYEDYAFVAELYDHMTLYAERPDVDFFLEAAQKAGGPGVEVGCGTGRVLLPLARAGIAITGLDRSPHMLAVCRRRLLQEPDEVQRRVRLVQGDMTDFDLGRTFDLVTIPFRPFQHLIAVEDQLSCLHTIRHHLQPDGRLILDLFDPSMERLTRDNIGRELFMAQELELPDGSQVRRSEIIVARDHAEQVQQIELIYYVTHPDGSVERLVHALPMRYLFRYEAEHLLVRCGFEVEALYADYNKSPYGTNYPSELIFIARKRPELE